MAKNKHHPPSHGGLVNETRRTLMIPDNPKQYDSVNLTGTQQATKKALGKMETLDEVLGTVLSEKPKVKFRLLDIETGMADDAMDYQPDFDLFKPEIKEPRYKKTGSYMLIQNLFLNKKLIG